MASLASSARLSERLYESPTKHAFFGRILPAAEERFSDDLTTEPLLLRVRPDCPITAGDEMVDELGRRFLLLEHDRTPIYRAHRLVFLTDQMNWTRAETIIDPVTRAKRQSAENARGVIWANVEIPKELRDAAVSVKQDLRRVITGARLELSDKLDGRSVTRVSYPLGVCLAEVV